MKEWRSVKLGSLLTESKIISESPNINKRITVKLNVQGIEKRAAINDKIGATKYFIRNSGQFIYGKQNLHKGAFGIIPEHLDGFESSSDIPAFDIDDSCYPEWIYYFFKKGNFYLKLETFAKGIGSKRIQPHQLFDLDILLPEKEEQKRIIDKIISIETKQNSVLIEFENQKKYLSELRLNTFEEAIQGKLTEKWRSENPNAVSPIRQMKLTEKKKEELTKEGQLRKEKPLLPLRTNDLDFEIPNNWIFKRLDNVMSIVGGVTKGKRASEKMISTPYLRVANVQRGFVDISEMKEILVSQSDYEKYQIEKNDILIIEGGDRDKVGRGAIWRNEIEGCIYQNHIFRLRPIDSQLINEEFVIIVINSLTGRKYFEKNAKQTTNLASINKTVVRNFILPIPPIQEQKEIAQKVNDLEADFVNLEIEIESKIENTNKLLQSILMELLRDEGNLSSIQKENDVEVIESKMRTVTFDNYTTLMDLVDLLKQHGKLHAEDLWKMSKFPLDIDLFYAELKTQIEIEKTIKEVKDEKGYLELSL